MTLRDRVARRFAETLSPTAPYLTYHGLQLTYEDIKIIKSQDWFTDNNIAFWEEWLEHETLPKYPQANIELLRPSMVTMIMNSVDRCYESALPKMDKVTHIFVPVTDATSRITVDGSHWSLLLISKIDRVAFHYDSMGGANDRVAAELTRRLSMYLNINLRYHVISDCPQQENGNDCGVFVCILMRHLLVKKLLNANAREKVSMSMSNKMIDAKGGRKEMLAIIESLRKEAVRRRSASPLSKSEDPLRID